MILPTITPDRIELAPGDELILRFRTWDDYEDLVARRLDRAGLRIKYSSATQVIRIMSPLPEHGKNADILADLVKVLLKYHGKDWDAFTPITLKRANLQGVEPDYCFYIENRQGILGKERLDLEVDPVPDLVIEIDLISTTKPEDYQVIPPRELWIYRRGNLLIYRFEGEGFQEYETSYHFPDFDVKEIIPQYIEQAWQVGSSVAVREFEEMLRKGN
ncbi:MAG: Uma2 family endonuclease [Nostocaceae cyanobacterium]|nr:Uma2 family endonuclease [Nostocaceae cyanobacterium]